MTLLITVFAAITMSIIWYFKDASNIYKIGTCALIFWSAALMWMCDAVAEYIELGAEYFQPSYADMINDAFLGVCVVALGLIIWIVLLVKSDPDKVFKKLLLRK